MHIEKSVVGILRKAEDKYGNHYEDWREPYINQPGLILVCQSDSQPEKYSIYFFTGLLCDCPGNWLHTTRGSIKEEGDVLTIRTKTVSMNLNWIQVVCLQKRCRCCYLM